jgi:hypothetical protein
MKEIFLDMIEKAILEIKNKQIDLYTFAFYHDHESHAISICIDTKPNSEKTVLKSNEFSMKYFIDSIGKKNIESAELHKYETGRSFSLGDFKYANLIRVEFNKKIKNNTQFYLDMVEAINTQKEKIKENSKTPENIVFCCSTKDNEVGLIWN